MNEDECISPIASCSWAAPIVPVLKPDESVRICGDYRLTVNRAIKLDRYPLPKPEGLFSALAGGKVFSKIDLSQAYAQLCLDESSKKYTTINTQRGLFCYNCLPYGVSSAVGLFQRVMEELLKDIPGLKCFLDDILVSGRDEKEHKDRLELVFQRLQDAGFRLKKSKCFIGVSSVEYLGFLIDANGIHPTTKKVEAITKAPVPTNVTQLQSYLGMLNFYRRFINNISTILEPLNLLLHKNVKWVWGPSQNKAFKDSKAALLNSPVLTNFDPNLPIVVSADSSSYGVGAVLAHVIDGLERPCYFAS